MDFPECNILILPRIKEMMEISVSMIKILKKELIMITMILVGMTGVMRSLKTVQRRRIQRAIIKRLKTMVLRIGMREIMAISIKKMRTLSKIANQISIMGLKIGMKEIMEISPKIRMKTHRTRIRGRAWTPLKIKIHQPRTIPTK